MHRHTVFFLSVVLLCGVAAAGSVAVEEKTTKGCKAIISKPKEKANEKELKLDWSGKCKDGYIDGYGTLTRQVNSDISLKITGTFRKGKVSGSVVSVFTAPQIKITRKLEPAKEAQSRGEQITETPQGRTRYVGTFNAVARHGTGRTEFPNGMIHEGEYRDDKIEGDGQMRMPDGMSVKGTFRRHNNVSSLSYARIEYPNGSTYEGEVDTTGANTLTPEFKPHGRGMSVSPDRIRYSGEFRDGVAEGQGIIQRPDGRSYDVVIRDGRVERLPSHEEMAQAARAEEARQAQENQRRADQARYEQAVWACRSRAANSVAPVQGSFGQMLSNIAQCNLDPEAFRTPPTQVIVVPTVQATPRSMTCSRVGVAVDCDFR